MMKCIIILAICASTVFSQTFFDDFENDHIGNWIQRGNYADWLVSNGRVHGSTSVSVCELVPAILDECLDVELQTYATGVHDFGMCARYTENDAGLVAYVSPDHNVARIRRVANGVPGTIYNSLYADFPSGVWYHLTLTCSGQHITFQIQTSDEYWELTATDPDPEIGTAGLHMAEEPSASWEWFSADCPGSTEELKLEWMDVDDDNFDESSGDGDHCFEDGEEIELALTLQNSGLEPLNGVQAVLHSLSPLATVTDSLEDYGSIPPDGFACCYDDFGLAALSGFAGDTTCPLMLEVTADGGFSQTINFEVPLGCGISDDMEDASNDWTSGSVDEGWGNDWHVSSSRNHTAGGCHSLKCGDTGAGDYSDHLYCYMESPWFNAPKGGTLHFWDWVDAQLSLNECSNALDGGVIQIGQFDTWITLEPVTGYPYTIPTGTTGPFPDGCGVLSGYSPWDLNVALIPDSLAGPLKVRFVFGSDDAGNREGWYIDDLKVTPDPNTDPLASGNGILGGNPLQVTPNPFTCSVQLITAAGRPGEEVCIFDLSGRIVRRLDVQDERSGTFVWDGRDTDGSEVPDGVYFASIEGTDAEPVTLIRIH